MQNATWILAVACGFVSACDTAKVTSAQGPRSSSNPVADDDCVQDAGTHEQIINACTDAVKIAKNPILPLLLPDGSLPPVP